MDHIPYFLLFILPLFTTLALTLTLTNSLNDLVTTTCKQTPDPPLCESALRSDPRSSKATNNEALILIMLDIVKTSFTDSLHYIQDLARTTHDPDTNRALQDCIRLFGVVLDTSIGLAVRAVQQGNPKFGEEATVDAGDEAEACRSGFPKSQVPSQITDRTRMLHGASNVIASMIKTLE